MKKTVLSLIMSSIFFLTSCSNNTSSNDIHSNQNIFDTIPFIIKKSRVIVNISIEKNNSIPMILDNGVLQTMLDKSYFDKTENLKIFKTQTIFGQNFTAFKLFSKINVNINSYNFVIDTILVADLKSFDPNIGNGILGYDFFKNKIVKISFADSRIIVSNNLPDTVGFQKFKLNNIPNKSVKYFIVKFNENSKNQELTIGIDLGSPFSHFRSGYILQFEDSINNTLYNKNNFTDILYKAIVTNKAELLRRSFPDHQYLNYDGLIGIAFLKKFDIIIDDINMYLYIKPIKPQ